MSVRLEGLRRSNKMLNEDLSGSNTGLPIAVHGDLRCWIKMKTANRETVKRGIKIQDEKEA
jgi:hypothetical protein